MTKLIECTWELRRACMTIGRHTLAELMSSYHGAAWSGHWASCQHCPTSL